MSPDTVSSLFPDRPIRPLPKRRLRERLSPEVADSIKYPPSPEENAPLFYYPPYNSKDEARSQRSQTSNRGEQSRRGDVERNYTPRQNGRDAADADVEGTSSRGIFVTRTTPDAVTRGARGPSRSNQTRHTNPQPPPSTTSSVDGYDSFENTNNKKKRKIPSAGDSLLAGAHALNAELASLTMSKGTSSTGDESRGGDRYAAHPYAPIQNANTLMSGIPGISGPGRGRLIRSRNTRSPLRTLPDGSNTWAGRRAAQSLLAPPAYDGGGIISNAIANAEKFRPQGQENVSLLEQHFSTGKSNPTAGQFTFTCDSQVPGTLQWPGRSNKQSVGTQTMGNTPARPGASANTHPGTSKTTTAPRPKGRRQARRELEKELRLTARERKEFALEDYFNNPPKPEDIWICELCEYERIFGEPPRALIRRYEMKDRKQRLEELDRKRLLEKAKAKSRKAKKTGSKLPTKAGQASGDTMPQGQPPNPANPPAPQAPAPAPAPASGGIRTGPSQATGNTADPTKDRGGTFTRQQGFLSAA